MAKPVTITPAIRAAEAKKNKIISDIYELSKDTSIPLSRTVWYLQDIMRTVNHRMQEAQDALEENQQ